MCTRTVMLLLVVGLGLPAGSALGQPRKKAKRAKVTKVAEAPAQPAEPEARPEAATPPPTRGPTRIDFDDRLIQGQTNAAGSVYLYDRKELELHPMVETRRAFFKELVSGASN